MHGVVLVIYLSPMSGPRRAWRHPNVGWMVVKNGGRRFDVPTSVAWAADCGLAVAESQDESVISDYIRWLDGLPCDRALCLFAVAPDVLGDAEATWRRSEPLLHQIRALGYPAAFVAQDGFNPDVIDWNAFDVLFIGGRPLVTKDTPPKERRKLRSQEWKRSERGGYSAIGEAKRRGKRVHAGRVNGAGFLRQLAAAGTDSADGSLLAHGPNKWWPLVCGALDGLVRQPTLSLEAASPRPSTLALVTDRH